MAISSVLERASGRVAPQLVRWSWKNGRSCEHWLCDTLALFLSFPRFLPAQRGEGGGGVICIRTARSLGSSHSANQVPAGRYDARTRRHAVVLGGQNVDLFERLLDARAHLAASSPALGNAVCGVGGQSPPPVHQPLRGAQQPRWPECRTKDQRWCRARNFPS